MTQALHTLARIGDAPRPVTHPPRVARVAARVAGLAIALLVLAPAAHADEGHDHGEAAPAAAGTALPRFTAESESFELVGVLEGTRLTLYLDRFDDNRPVEGAALELEIGGKLLKAAARGEGEFEVVLAEPPAAGIVAVTATVLAGTETDLLVGELDLHDEAHADEGPAAPGRIGIAAWAAGGLALLGLLAVLVRRARNARRASPSARAPAMPEGGAA